MMPDSSRCTVQEKPKFKEIFLALNFFALILTEFLKCHNAQCKDGSMLYGYWIEIFPEEFGEMLSEILIFLQIKAVAGILSVVRGRSVDIKNAKGWKFDD